MCSISISSSRAYRRKNNTHKSIELVIVISKIFLILLILSRGNKMVSIGCASASSGKEHRSHSEFLLTRNSVGQDTKNRIQQTQVLHSPFFARHDIIVCSCSDNIRAICCRMYVCVCVCLGIMYVNIYLILKFYTYLSVHAMKI